MYLHAHMYLLIIVEFYIPLYLLDVKGHACMNRIIVYVILFLPWRYFMSQAKAKKYEIPLGHCLIEYIDKDHDLILYRTIILFNTLAWTAVSSNTFGKDHPLIWYTFINRAIVSSNY